MMHDPRAMWGLGEMDARHSIYVPDDSPPKYKKPVVLTRFQNAVLWTWFGSSIVIALVLTAWFMANAHRDAGGGEPGALGGVGVIMVFGIVYVLYIPIDAAERWMLRRNALREAE